jgi:hypothetical protein
MEKKEKFIVYVDDNFNYMDVNERYTHGEYDSYEAALGASKTLVIAVLNELHTPSMTANELYRAYATFGEEPWISCPSTITESEDRFSAWDYAKEQAKIMCEGLSLKK